MTQSFDDWFDSQDDVGCALGLEGYAAERAWNARQAEIDELQKRIDIALNKSEDFYDFGDGESAMAFCNDIINILKGKKDE